MNVLVGPNAFRRGRREPRRRAGGASEETERRESLLAFALQLCLSDKPVMTVDFTATDAFFLPAYGYISLQLRSEKEKQTPVIDTSQQIPVVAVRARRSVPAGCVCVCGSRWAQLNPSIPSASSLHAGFPLSHFYIDSASNSWSPASDSGLNLIH